MSISNIVRRERKLKAAESQKAQPIKALKLHRIGYVEAGGNAVRVAFLREEPYGSWRLSA